MRTPWNRRWYQRSNLISAAWILSLSWLLRWTGMIGFRFLAVFGSLIGWPPGSAGPDGRSSGSMSGSRLTSYDLSDGSGAATMVPSRTSVSAAVWSSSVRSAMIGLLPRELEPGRVCFRQVARPGRGLMLSIYATLAAAWSSRQHGPPFFDVLQGR